ncbi:MAG: mechanosensitive ion channel domain-containing protein [Nanoarchaeota archaeon]
MDFSTIVSGIEDIITSITPAVNVVVTTILIFLLGFILGKIVGKLVYWALKQVNLDSFARKYLKLNTHFQRTISTIITYAIYIITVYIGLERLHVVRYIFYILLGAVLVFAIMSFLTTLKDFFPNMAAGVYLKRKRFFRIGDEISFAGVKGKIIDVGLLSTEILTLDDEQVIVPNSALKKNVVKVKKGR